MLANFMSKFRGKRTTSKIGFDEEIGKQQRSLDDFDKK